MSSAANEYLSTTLPAVRAGGGMDTGKIVFLVVLAVLAFFLFWPMVRWQKYPNHALNGHALATSKSIGAHACAAKALIVKNANGYTYVPAGAGFGASGTCTIYSGASLGVATEGAVSGLKK